MTHTETANAATTRAALAAARARLALTQRNRRPEPPDSTDPAAFQRRAMWLEAGRYAAEAIAAQTETDDYADDARALDARGSTALAAMQAQEATDQAEHAEDLATLAESSLAAATA